MSLDDIALRFFLEVMVILVAIRIVGLAARRLRQPPVLAEMIAGVALGPSLFGLLAPGGQTWLFPAEVKSVIFTFAQVGIAFYMFVVGLEFNPALVRQHLRSSTAVAAAGIVVPFALGAAVGYAMVGNPMLFSATTSTGNAMLFLGAALSITAFPMLARIIQESGMSGTKIGTLALAAGSLDDVAAWCILAVVLASFSSDGAIALRAIGGGALYVVALLLVVRPMLRRMEAVAQAANGLTRPMLSVLLALLALCAWFTDYVRIYAVFGAFLLGLVMPRGVMSRDLHAMLEPTATAFLVPLFFVYSGLNTRLGLVTPALWGMTLLVLVAAVVGKAGGCWAAARLAGEDNRHAMAIGALMNARGLMELILLNIGLRAGIITSELFAIGILMAVVTTLMATPMFHWAYALRPTPDARRIVERVRGEREVLDAGARAGSTVE